MNIIYPTHLTPEESKTLEEHGWKITPFSEDPRYQKTMEHYAVGVYPENNGLYMNCYYASQAEKDFDSPGAAMLEIECLLSVDVIGETDQDGCPLHSFHWENPDYNGFVAGDNYDWTIPIPPEAKSHCHASGWSCATWIYGAPATPREAAIELFKLRNEQNGKK